MSIIIAIIVSCIVSGLLTWKITLKRFKKRTTEQVLSGHVCPFQSACTVYDGYNTTEAARRVARLIIENVENEEEYKKQIYELLTYQKKG